ncbi:MAG: ribonuclease P protein component [Paenibacillus sp. RIFOXYA1_FULL_44_5]|nr:MAG: ribonuclease P protein component [Paenibacillus sp. RIFOXYA1_FULL_44_5]
MQRHLRLTKRDDFNKVYRFGKSVANQQFVIYCFGQEKIEQFRMGVSVSKKIGNAVVRNRLRRLIKEVVRLHQTQVVSHIDFIVIARKPVLQLVDYDQFEKSLLHLMRKAKLFEKNTI